MWAVILKQTWFVGRFKTKREAMAWAAGNGWQPDDYRIIRDPH
jgi:hypothetical protein